MGGMRKDKPLRFVIQRHTRDEERPHWDLMLEKGRGIGYLPIGLAP
jgi:hypothetical protein